MTLARWSIRLGGYAFALALAAAAPVACGPPGGMTGGAAQPKSPWSAGVKKVVIEVDYAPGAEPFTGKLPKFGDTWGLFETNAKKLLGPGRTLEAPHTLAEMQALPDVAAGNFDEAALLAIAQRHQDRRADSATVVYYVVWVNGYYSRNGKIDKGVLGVHLSGTNVIGMFKPTIVALGSDPGPHVEKFVEQTTLIHEFGHAVGLVANGIPPEAPHEDTGHPHHCTNTGCVMYFEVEGKAGAQELIKKRVADSGSVIWGLECLADVAP